MGLQILRSPLMDAREHVCYFHWTQSLEKHTKLYIKHDLQDQHKHLCLQYCDASSMLEAETRYLAIKAWWASSSCTSEEGLKHLQLWLALSISPMGWLHGIGVS